MTAAARSAIPSEQRIFSLVLALVAQPIGATRHQLLSSVYGYAERYTPGVANTALERQFERDKDALRSLGIPVETLDSPQEPGNNQLARYRISRERLEFPRSLRFTGQELTLLRLAALAWSEGSRSPEARRAVMKLESLGAGLDVQHLGVAPSLGAREPAAAALQSAIDTRKAVEFAYQLPNRSEPLMRRAAPLRLHRADGRWHLIAWDLERDAGRVFLLSRIIGRATTTRKSFDSGLLDRADGLIAEMSAHAAANPATLEVACGSVAEARLAPRAVLRDPAVDTSQSERVTLELGVLDRYEFADELVGYGDEVAVVAPPELRDLVVARLRSIASAHGAAGEGGAT